MFFFFVSLIFGGKKLISKKTRIEQQCYQSLEIARGRGLKERMIKTYRNAVGSEK